MIRKLAIAAIGSVLLGCATAQAQDLPELDGAPGPLRVPKTAPVQPKPAPAKPTPAKPTPAKPTSAKPTPAKSKPAPAKAVAPDKTAPVASKSSPSAAQLTAMEARLAGQAEAQSAQAARLAQQAADLKAREARLDVRAADLAAAEKRLADQRAQQEADLAAKAADLDRRLAAASRAQPERASASRDGDAPVPPAAEVSERSYRSPGLDLALAKRSCAVEAQAEARARNYVSASYDSEPRLNRRTMELRGLMRLDDLRGYRLVDSVCELTPEGEAAYFEFLR